MDPERYRRWLEVRGVENPSDADVAILTEQTRGNPYCTLLELLFAVWGDSRGGLAVTRGYLRARGLWDPTEDVLRAWSSAIRRAALRRTCVLLAAQLAYFAFLGWAGVHGLLFWVGAPLAIVICGLGVSAGTKLMGSDRVALEKAARRDPHGG